MPHESIRKVSASKSVNMLLFGGPSSGKTSFIGSGSEKVKQLIIRPPADHVDSILGKNVDEWIIDTWGGMEEAQDFAMHQRGEYDWIWWDGVSVGQDFLLDDIWEDVLAKRPDRKGQNPDKGEYGMNMTRIKKWTRSMIGMPNFNFGMTAIATDLTDENGNALKLRPWIQGKNMSPTVAGYFNLVGYMDVVTQKDGERRVLRFNDCEEYTAKDQFNLFPGKKLVDPTMPALLEALAKRRGAKTTTTKPAARRRRVARKA